VPSQFAGLLVDPEQGGQRHCHLDRRAQPLSPGQPRVVQRRHPQIDQRVRPALITTAGIVGRGDRGERIDRRQDRGGALDRQQRPQFGHPVLTRCHGDAAFGHRLDALLVHGVGGDRGDGPAHGAGELGQGLLTGPGQHPLLH
jgi:hypothetical protein